MMQINATVSMNGSILSLYVLSPELVKVFGDQHILNNLHSLSVRA